jgi:hypothetical protein
VPDGPAVSVDVLMVGTVLQTAVESVAYCKAFAARQVYSATGTANHIFGTPHGGGPAIQFFLVASQYPKREHHEQYKQ